MLGFPAEVKDFLRSVTFVISLGIEGLPFTCLGMTGYVQRLWFWMLLPFGYAFRRKN